LYQLLTALSFKIIPPHIYLAIVCLSWGIIASLQSLTVSFTQLLLLRAVLGMAEAAFSGVPFYLSFFYRREELAFRTGVFIAAAPLATTFASSLAWLITWVAQSGSFIAPWRLLFLVEGFPSVFVAWYCFKNVADDPGSAWFLTKKEKKIAVARLKTSDAPSAQSVIDEVDGRKKPERKIRFSEVLETLKDPKSYITAAMFFSNNVAFSSMPVFLPTIITE
jgi:MFS family permease